MGQFNILNEAEVTAFCERLGRKADDKWIAAWVNGIFRKWMLSDFPHIIQVIDARELWSSQTNLMDLSLKAQGSKVNIREEMKLHNHLVDVKTLPDWAADRLREGYPLHFVSLPAFKDTDETFHMFTHWLDFCSTLPKRDIKYLVPDLVKAVAKWDLDRQREVLLGKLEDGVSPIASKVFDESKYVLVRLMTKESYKHEGQAMDHCVGTSNYWGKKQCVIYSVRSSDPDAVRPAATFEVTKGKLVQLRDYKDRTPAEDVIELVKMWCAETGVNTAGAIIGDNDEDDDEDEYDDEYDEDEDGNPVNEEDEDENEDDDDDEEDDEDEWDDEPRRPVRSAPAVALASCGGDPEEVIELVEDCADFMQDDTDDDVSEQELQLSRRAEAYFVELVTLVINEVTSPSARTFAVEQYVDWMEFKGLSNLPENNRLNMEGVRSAVALYQQRADEKARRAARRRRR